MAEQRKRRREKKTCCSRLKRKKKVREEKKGSELKSLRGKKRRSHFLRGNDEGIL